MTDTTNPTTTSTLPIPIPATLETPPRTTGNVQMDMVILINWFWRAYQVITQSVAYINSQVANPEFNVAALPDPTKTTLAQAQLTANNAYNLANTANIEAVNNTAALVTVNNDITIIEDDLATETANIATNTAAIAAQAVLWSNLISGTFTISNAAVAATIAFGAAEANLAFKVMVQAISSTGAPVVGAFVVAAKTYTVNNFTVTIFSAPGAGNSVTFEWQLIRNT